MSYVNYMERENVTITVICIYLIKTGQVEVESEPCGSSGVTCTKGVYVSIGDADQDSIVLRSLETAIINGLEVSLPYRYFNLQSGR